MLRPTRRSARSRAKRIGLSGVAVLLVAGGLTVTRVVATEQAPILLRALEEQEALVRAHPDNSVALNDLGNLLELDSRREDAEAAYFRAIEIDPRHASARFNLALLMMQRSAHNEAQEQLEAVLELEPDHAWAHYQLGILIARRGDRSQAIDRYARAFALDPSLSFAEVNPHVIDNELMTPALLTAQRYFKTSNAKVPRQYGDRVRIAALLLGVDPPEEGGTFGDVLDEARQLDEEDLGPIEGEDDDYLDEQARGAADSDTEGLPRRVSRAVPADEEGGSRAGERVLTTDDLDASDRTGEAVGGTLPNRRRGPGSVFNRYRPPQNRAPTTRSQATRPQAAAPSGRPTPRRGTVARPVSPPAGGQGVDRQGAEERGRGRRIRSSRRSSAQLEIVLETEVVAG